AVDERQIEHVTRIDQVGIAYLRIGLPDFRPQPGLDQETGGDVPQRVATAHGVIVGMIGAQLRACCVDGHGYQQAGQQDDGFSDHCWESPSPYARSSVAEPFRRATVVRRQKSSADTRLPTYNEAHSKWRQGSIFTKSPALSA